MPNKKATYVKCHGRQAWLVGLSWCSQVVVAMSHHRYGQRKIRKTKKVKTNMPMFAPTAPSEKKLARIMVKWTVETYREGKRQKITNLVEKTGQ